MVRASIFFQLTKTPETSYQAMVQQIEAKGAQMEDKEHELFDLQKENERLKQELEFQHGQQAYINEYQMSPFLNQNMLFQNQQQQKKTTQVTQGSVEQRVIDQYAAGSSVDYQQDPLNADFDIDRKIRQTEPIEFLNQNYNYEP